MEDCDKVRAVQRMQIYIDEHIHEKISLKNLADAAGYSPWHADRIFKELTGRSPFEYIRACRLSQAAINLRDCSTKTKIIDVALDYLFDSHEGFTRAFSKQFGVAPKSYQQKPKPIALFMPYKVLPTHKQTGKRRDATMNKNNEQLGIFVQIIERPKRRAIILRGHKAEDYFAYCEEVSCDVWGILTSVKEAMYEPAGFWLPDSWIKPGTSKYVQGVEVPEDYNGEIPDGYELIDMPACTMMIFQSEPYEDENFGEAIENVWKLIERYDPKLYGFEWAPEDGPRFQLEPQGYRGYIEGKPVRKI